MVKKEVIKVLKKYIMLLNSEGIPVYKAFLYGSYSQDKGTEKSDIDVLIVSDNFDENDDKTVGLSWTLTRKVNSKIEPFLIGTSKFLNDGTSPLISLVKSSGIEIVL